MNYTITQLSDIKNKTSGYWANRVISQLEYAIELSKVEDDRFNDSIKNAVEFLNRELVENGSITKGAVSKTEEMLSELTTAAKNFKILCAAHAHIDMNWQWGYAETAALTLDTFRTILDLMKEYPELIFSQSQASVYKIVEDYDPCMLEEIKKRVKEGRWEVTASTWVETDKNMPNGESLARHILYTKRYLSNLLDICPESLEIDFEPDTFGHNVNIPEILSKGGIKYYYHCRGYEKHHIYRWQSPSGESVLVYREPFWYNARIESSMALHVPSFCTKHGLNTMLKVYGLGDHGGGPTRKDIESIMDMATWPIFPNISFGTFSEYFKIAEKVLQNLPVETDELNFIFTGCYTSQSRIKLSNRISEAKLDEAEIYSTISSIFVDGEYRNELLEKAWRKVLFNQFHDILPGSCVIETREHAMGQFQQVLAIVNNETSRAFRNITSKINTKGLFVQEEDFKDSCSEGAGVGFAVGDFGVPQTERGKGKGRIIHFFNPSKCKRKELVEIILWDWPGDSERMQVKDSKGNPIRHQILKGDKQGGDRESYWGHEYLRVLVDVEVPPYGYTTYTVTERKKDAVISPISSDGRIDKEDILALENEYIKACFDTNNLSILSIIDRKTGKELIPCDKPAGVFRLIEEDDRKGMTSWRIGRYMRMTNLNDHSNVRIVDLNINPKALKQWIKYNIVFGESKLSVVVSLDYNSKGLNYSAECDWQERGMPRKYVPQLNFHLPLNYKCKTYRCDIPFSTIDRGERDMDVPGNSWMAGIPEEGNGAVMLITDTKYGFRGFKDSLAVSLIRSSFSPDPYPEFGIHKFNLAIEVVEEATNVELIRKAYDYNHPIRFISGRVHEGSLPPEKGFISVESGNINISSVKVPENQLLDNSPNKQIIMRVYEADGEDTRAVIKFDKMVSKAWVVDINERPITDERISNGCKISLDCTTLEFNVEAYSIKNICVEFC